MSKNKISFIINPHSGVSRKNNLPELIERLVDKDQWEASIKFTEAPGHATILAKEASEENTKVIVAVGGDGSVNETGAGVLGSESTLGIVPCGSGNGMARHLLIPVHLEKSIQLFNSGKSEKIDSILINNRFCIGTFGTGFDAHIAHLFSKSAKRGYSTYVKLVLSEFYKYQPVRLQLEIENQKQYSEHFMLTFANSSQFGNNAVIAPHADVQDGKLDITMMNRFPALVAPALIWRLMNNSLHQSKYFTGQQTDHVKIHDCKNMLAHIDGEPVTFNGDIDIKIQPKSINVWIA